MYRPEGWENPFQEEVDFCMGKDLAAPEHQLRAYEAGADAMLKGLKKGLKPTLKPGRIGDAVVGYLVFIPEN